MGNILSRNILAVVKGRHSVGITVILVYCGSGSACHENTGKIRPENVKIFSFYLQKIILSK